jgi:hypothetical protein
MMSRRTLASRIAAMSRAQQREIYNIVIQSGVKVSQNANGFFFDLDTVPADCLSKIQAFVTYSFDNKDTLDAYDRQLQMCKVSRSVLYPSSECRSGAEQSDAPDAEDEQTPLPCIPTRTFQYPRVTGGSSPKRSSVKFSDAKKRFAKPPRHKVFDPDDVSDLAITCLNGAGPSVEGDLVPDASVSV